MEVLQLKGSTFLCFIVHDHENGFLSTAGENAIFSPQQPTVDIDSSRFTKHRKDC